MQYVKKYLFMNLITHRDVNHIFIGFWYFNVIVLGVHYQIMEKEERQLFNKVIILEMKQQ